MEEPDWGSVHEKGSDEGLVGDDEGLPPARARRTLRLEEARESFLLSPLRHMSGVVGEG